MDTHTSPSSYASAKTQNGAVELNTSQPSTPNNCAICLDLKDDKSSALTELQCAHTFHTECISRWLTSNNQLSGSCPECRQPHGLNQRLEHIEAQERPTSPASLNASSNTRSNITELTASPWRTIGTLSTLYTARIALSAAAGACGSAMLKHSKKYHPAPIGPITLETLAGSSIVTIPILLGLMHKKMPSLGIAGVLSMTTMIGFESLHSVLGNMVLNHPDVPLKSAAVAGFMGGLILPAVLLSMAAIASIALY
ncbi:MAG: RING finger domain-containing protein [Gammaproteobacteria bacterium]